MAQIRFIHGADLHLDSPFQGLKHLPDPLFRQVRESTFKALDKLIEHAIIYKVDFVILAGDLFDGENRSLKAQSRLKKAMEQLDEVGISCFIIHGNHDHLNGSWVELTWPKNVFFFKDQVDSYQFKKENLDVQIYGYSYPEKSVKENIAMQYEKIGHADYHIGILHGTADGQLEHDLYAPFTVNQLLEKAFDYWALGHIHKRQILHENPYICYSGNIQGRHKKELGEKGVFLVELNKQKNSQVTFLSTSDIFWDEVTVSIDGLTKVEELKHLCETVINKRERDANQFILLHFKGSGSLHEYLIEQVEELIEVLNIDQEEKHHFTYIIDKKIDSLPEWDRTQLKTEQHLVSDIITASDRLKEREHLLKEVLTEITTHPKLARYIDLLTEEQQKQVINDAESFVLTALLKERNDM